MNLEPRPSSHLYPIANQSNEWCCGSDAVGRQVFIYLDLDCTVAICFDHEGNLAEVIKRPLLPYSPSGGPGWMEAKDARDEDALDSLREELGFVGGTIRIRRQSVEQLIIEDWPSYFVDFVANPNEVEPVEAHWQRLCEGVSRWQREGCYVLWFGKDYWMEGDGTIGST